MGHGALLALHDLGAHPFPTLALFAGTFIAFLAAAARAEKGASPAVVLAGAAVLRLLLLPLPPTLSDDVRRYLWDGKVVTAGYDPYRLPPDAAELSGLRDAAWLQVPHRQVPTVYPPLALGAFSIASLSPWPLWSLKILLTAADLVGCRLLLAIAAARGLPAGRVAGYAWNPLVTLEVAGMAHVDALVVAASSAAVLLLLPPRRRPLAASGAAVLSVLAKLVPAVALPMWARQSGRPLRFLAASGVLLLATLGPLVVESRGVPPGLVTYGVSWEHDGPLYEPLWRLLDRLAVSDLIKGRLDRLKEVTGQHALWNRFYPFVYPQLLAKLLLVGLFFFLWLRTLGAEDPVTGSGRLFGALLLSSATVYPWYLLWVLPWAALTRHPAWLAASGLAPLAYLARPGGLELFPWIYLAIWGPFFLLLLTPLWRRRWSTA